MLKTRLITAAVLLVAFCGALFGLPAAGWAMVLVPLAVACAFEWAAMAGWPPVMRGLYALLTVVVCGLLWFESGLEGGFAQGATAAFMDQGKGVAGDATLWCAAVFWLLIVPLWLGRGLRVRAAAVLVPAGLMLIVPLWLAFVRLHDQPWLLLFLLGIPWISDTAAYACGRAWGRRKLAPQISPAKTWEGAFGAAAAIALYYGILCALAAPRPPVLQGAGGLGVFLILMVLGMEGDLFESWVKRTAGVKDSGTLLPGHGGVLDRVDALCAAMPLAVLLLEHARWVNP